MFWLRFPFIVFVLFTDYHLFVDALSTEMSQRHIASRIDDQVVHWRYDLRRNRNSRCGRRSCRYLRFNLHAVQEKQEVRRGFYCHVFLNSTLIGCFYSCHLHHKKFIACHISNLCFGWFKKKHITKYSKSVCFLLSLFS